MRKLFLLVTFIFSTGICSAQVIVQLQQPPPFQFKLENMWKVTLINSTGTDYRVYLQGTATESTSGLIAEATTATFILTQGTRFISPVDIMPISVHSANGKYDEVVKNIGGVPSGEYEICVSVINADDGLVLGSQCIQQEVMNLTQIELLGPGDNAFIESGKSISGLPSADSGTDEIFEIVNGSFIVFNWLPPSPVEPSQAVTYSITITEMLGLQSSYDALQSNPAFYKQGNIYSTIFQFPSAAREFSPGKKYAWQVSAYFNGVLISTSEVRNFTFGKFEDSQTRVELKPGSGLPVGLSGLMNSGNINYFNQPAADGDTKSVLTFSGTAKLENQVARRQGFNSEQPERYTNLELSPALSIYGLPFSSDILLTSQQDDLKQNMNSFALNFDIESFRDNLMERVEAKADELAESEAKQFVDLTENLENISALKTRLEELAENPENSKEIDSLKTNLAVLEEIQKRTAEANEIQTEIENMKDPENLEATLDKYNMISGTEKILMSIQTIGFGVTYPAYTPHTLNGVPVNGVNIEINPAFFYLAFAGTGNQKGITNSTYRRNLYAGRFGVGTKEGSHFHLTGLYAKDDENSIVVEPTNLTLNPQANYLFGVEGKLAFLDNHLTFEGEIVGSVLTRDTRAADLENKAIPGFIKNMVHPKISSSFDFMYSAKTSYSNDETNTKVSFGMKMIGPGFASLGAPTLRSDYLGYEGKIDQKLINKRISLSASFKSQRDNLIDWKSYTTTTTAFNINLGLRFPKLPIITFLYSPYFQKNNTTEQSNIVDNKTAMYSVMTSYSYPVMNFQSSTNFSFSLQQTKTFAGTADFSTDNYMLTQTAAFISGLSFAGSFGIIHLKPVGVFSRITTFDISSSFPVFEVVQGTIGFRTAVEKDKNNKYGVYANASVSLLDWFSLDVRVENSTYNEWNYVTEYSDTVLRTTLRAAW
ncbi:MAG: hypothetical protein V1720_22030 [bacterium]